MSDSTMVLPSRFNDFSFAFQPIVELATGHAYSHEALVRGAHNEPAYKIFERYAAEDQASFDAACREKAIEVATRIGLDTYLNLNIMPCAVLDAATGLDTTVRAAERNGFPLERIIVEVTEVNVIEDASRFAAVINEFRRAGLQFAIDDFGAGYAGLSLLSDFQPDIVKLDMGLVRGIESDGPRQAIVRAINQVCLDLGIEIVAEGIETVEELAWFSSLGVPYAQGYLFAKPMFEGMPAFTVPELKENTPSTGIYHLPPGGQTSHLHV